MVATTPVAAGEIQRKTAMAAHNGSQLKRLILWTLGLLALKNMSAVHSISTSEKQLYIVYMGSNKIPHALGITAETHSDLLSSVLGSAATGKTALVHSYIHGLNGFSAMLSASEAAQLSEMPGVVSTFPSVSCSLQTTRTWDYMGVNLDGESWTSTNFGKDVIVATIDTGVWPEHESFDDEGMDPIPEKWKGECETGQSFPEFYCNRKLIGARYFSEGYEAIWGQINTSDPTVSLSPRDTEGHGTHTITTLGGSRTTNVSFQGTGLAVGTARGGASNARVAAYKVCWPGSCQTADILAAFDMAIHDGVDVISISLGASAIDYFYDSIAIGAFHATDKGILVVAAGGNSGPSKATVSNGAPWILTAAASSIDREFLSDIHLGNNVTYSGPSLNTEKIDPNVYPLVDAGNIPAQNITSTDARMCGPDSLDAKKVKGNIVVCVPGDMLGINYPEVEVYDKGGVATIMVDDELKSYAQVFRHPAVTVVSQGVGSHILSYINSTRSPVATMTLSLQYLGIPAPIAAKFSSRGPNVISPDVLKPDLIAPGVSILAGWSPAASPSEDPSDIRTFQYNFLSGTSMSTPHIAGVAALLKAEHPDWSPAAIKSALMTTATPLDSKHNQNSHGDLTWGSGHIDPKGAIDPGLVYNTTSGDYKLFLCSMNYTDSQIRVVTGTDTAHVTCPKARVSASSLNYPTIAASNFTNTITVVRTVTNVGAPTATYRAEIDNPAGVRVRVSPDVLNFTPDTEVLSYTATLEPMDTQPWLKNWVFGALIWDDGRHRVRTAIAVGPTVDSPFF
uniref:Subtilisin-like protease n=1 Tax=Physcomitrium patens TaxID=3218 RepID=A0A7I4AJU4_PHYPA|nr:subtilisin-like protease SBT5.3 isoform X2 [Physcomitrium patens]|eukprot:XP_024390186.1 subtilisin-like protease SBT5.3 isoform X2 [Physcomitrella patens]